MLDFLKRNHKPKLEMKVLRNNDISILILDERWHKLFENIARTPEIIGAEEYLKDLIKKEAALFEEQRDITKVKKQCLDKIMQLTSEVFIKENALARCEMQKCEEEVKRINKRFKEFDDALLTVFHEIKDANLNLLEIAVQLVYLKMKKDEKRVKELEGIIEETRNKLKEYIDEKGLLSQDSTDVYTYFHDILGAEEVERLDQEYT